jgi:hypothetical protein
MGRAIRTGDAVEVRSAAEILATLDETGSLNGQPFMPEMLKYVGKRFSVSSRLEKICNNVDSAQSDSRRMRATVHLDELRCDGSAHGGCQMACRLYWREEWLRPTGQKAQATGTDALRELAARARAGTRAIRELDGQTEEVWRCQATEALVASEPLNKLDPRQFIREVRAGNVTVPHLLAVMTRMVWSKALRVLRLRKMLPLQLPPSHGVVDTREPAGLESGDLVEVRSREEIAATLDHAGHNRGLSFSPEMLRYCGRRFRVRDRVRRLVDERNGRMIEISTDCFILEGAVCPGEDGCWAYLFCPHGTFPFWREAWLRRIEAGG